MGMNAKKAMGIVGVAGAGLSVIGGLAQTFSGIFGAKKRKKELEALLDQRPEYSIPQEASEQLGSARTDINARLDEQQDLKQSLFTQQQNQLAKAQAAGGSLNDMLALGAASSGGMQDALIKNRISGAQERQVRKQRYDEALANMSEYRDQAFQINEMDPYKERLAAMQQLKRDNREMTFGGLNQAGAGLMQGAASAISGGLV